MVELPHQGRTERVIHSPEVGDNGASAGGDEWPDQAGDAVLSLFDARARVAGRQGDEGSIQSQIQNLARLQQTVLRSRWPQQQRRAGRRFRTDDAVRGEMDDAVVRQRLCLDGRLRGFGVDEHDRVGLTEHATNETRFLNRLRQRTELRDVEVVRAARRRPRPTSSRFGELLWRCGDRQSHAAGRFGTAPRAQHRQDGAGLRIRDDVRVEQPTVPGWVREQLERDLLERAFGADDDTAARRQLRHVREQHHRQPVRRGRHVLAVARRRCQEARILEDCRPAGQAPHACTA